MLPERGAPTQARAQILQLVDKKVEARCADGRVSSAAADAADAAAAAAGGRDAEAKLVAREYRVARPVESAARSRRRRGKKQRLDSAPVEAAEENLDARLVHSHAKDERRVDCDAQNVDKKPQRQEVELQGVKEDCASVNGRQRR